MTDGLTRDDIVFISAAGGLIPAAFLPWFQSGATGFDEPFGGLVRFSIVLSLGLAGLAAVYRRVRPDHPWQLFGLTVGGIELALGLVPFAAMLFKLMAVDLGFSPPTTGWYLSLALTALVAYHAYLVRWDESQAQGAGDAAGTIDTFGPGATDDATGAERTQPLAGKGKGTGTDDLPSRATVELPTRQAADAPQAGDQAADAPPADDQAADRDRPPGPADREDPLRPAAERWRDDPSGGDAR